MEECKMESCLSKNIYVYYGSEHFNRDLLKKDNNKDIPKFSLVGISLKSENGWKKWRNDNNMNKIKAILHNKVLVEMKKRESNYDSIVVDQFVYPAKYFEHIKETKEIVRDIDFTTKAESKWL